MWSGLTPCEFDLDFKILGQRSEYKYEANKYYNGPTLASAQYVEIIEPDIDKTRPASHFYLTSAIIIVVC